MPTIIFDNTKKELLDKLTEKILSGNSDESAFEAGKCYNFHVNGDVYRTLRCTEVFNDGSAKFEPA